MADKVRILGLDDDNHAPMFRMETGKIYNSPRELIEFLSHSHDVEYQVRMFAIVEQPSEALAKYDMEDIDWMFMFLEGLTSALPSECNDPNLVFELFWDSANKEWW